jgi:acetyl esterase
MVLPYPTLPGDVDRAVADDHAVVLCVLEHLESGGGDRPTLAAQLAQRFALLSGGMEQVVLPALDRPGTIVGYGAQPRSVHEAVQEARTGQQNSKERIAVLAASDPGSAEFGQALLRLIEGARVHADQIEGELLPALRSSGADVRELGRAYTEAKHRAPSHSHPDAPDSPTASRLAAVATSVIDRLVDRTSGRSDRLGTDASGLLDADVQVAVDAYAAHDPRPLDTLSPAEAREQHPFTAANELAERQEVAGVPVRLYRPVGLEAPPVLVYAHGGGGVVGSALDATAQALCEHADCLVVSVDYRLAPEYPFPAGHEDVQAVLEWVLANAGELGGDPERVAVAGEAAGANLIASACLNLDAEAPRPAAALLITPLTTAAQDTPSMLEAADATPLDRPAVSWCLSHLFADPTDAADPRFALLEAPAEALAGLPPTFVLTADRDPLRDQGEQFAARLAEAGVVTTVTRYDGVPHGFFGLGSEVQASVQAQTDAAETLRTAYDVPAELPLEVS